MILPGLSVMYIPYSSTLTLISLEYFRRALTEMRGEILREFREELRSMDQHLAGLEQDARQPRLAIGADGLLDTNARERTEGAAKAV